MLTQADQISLCSASRDCTAGHVAPIALRAAQAALAVIFFLTAPTLTAQVIATGGTALRSAMSW